MSGSRPHAARGGLSEQHLGDRLAAFVDGELGHDARERVLAHLATCPRCKADADAQRRLKSVFAQTAPPPPSQSFLERLQGLPGGPGAGTAGPFGGGPLGGGPGRSAGRAAAGAGHAPAPSGALAPAAPFGGLSGPAHPPRPGRPQTGARPPAGPGGFPYAPARPSFAPGRSPLAPALALAGEGRGFRIHDLGRPEPAEPGRTASRGRRFAFAAAGAVSLAALALGGVSSGAPTDGPAEARGSSATPQRAQSVLGVPAESTRRRTTGGPAPLSAQGGTRGAPVRPTLLSAPLNPGGTTTGVVPAVVRPPLLPGPAPVYSAAALRTPPHSVPDTFLRPPAEQARPVTAEAALPTPPALPPGR
ncbi:zf-HC2 domain-containing protein [Streptomyces sp. NPDC049954]|uniref:anti-sigma factor family protein n=1 Tax=Streptomyces sp. NPDC049954 TaxID=3155779 RepID=UPI003441C615